MFGITFIKTKELNHLTTECSKLAITNVELSKENTHQSKTIQELVMEIRVLNSKLSLQECINADLQKKINCRFPRKLINKKLKR